MKSPALGQNFSAKARPPSQETPTPGEYFEGSSQLFLLIDVKILKFCRNQTSKRTGRLSNYSLAIPSSLSLSAILEVLKFSVGTLVIDNRSNPPGNSDGTNLGTRAKSSCKILGDDAGGVDTWN